MRLIKITSIFLLLILFYALPSFAQDRSNVNNLQTLAELQDSIKILLNESNTLGAGIVLVSSDSIVFIEGMGKANIVNNIDANENTMFRLGSVSKLLVGLAILKLQEDGLLNLKDKVSDVIPDIEIVNPWDEEHPIRIEHLLEHTSGIPDWSLAELASNDSTPKTLKESLMYYPKGREAKFVPGTRIKYSNLAVSIAAYIVETVSGTTYEDYIERCFFKPLGMGNSTFRFTDQYQKLGAKGYNQGVEMPYLHVLYRPSVSLISSPKDLAHLLMLFINRGKADSTQLLSGSSLNRMERNESLHIDKSALFKSNGLVNYASVYNNFSYRGHGGSVPGANADFQYLPEYNRGYAIMLNGNNQGILRTISNLIKEYQTKNLPQFPADDKFNIHKPSQDLTGYYMGINHKFNAIKFFTKIKSLTKFWHEGDTLYVNNVLGQYPNKFYSNGNNEFVSADSDKYLIFQTIDPVEGEVIYGHMGLFKKIAPIYAYLLLTIFFAFFIVPVIVFVLMLIRLIIYLLSNKKDKIALWISLWPFISSSFILAIIVALFGSIHSQLDAFMMLGNMSPLSVLIFIGTIGFALSSLSSVYYVFKHRDVKMSKVFYYLSAATAIFNVIFTVYFISNGLIGLITWI